MRAPLRRAGAVAGGLLVLCLLLAAPVFALPQQARADDGDNVVNTQQPPDSSFIYDTSITDLSKADSYYDNQTVQVVGEVIGDLVRADPSGRYVWVTLSAKGDSATLAVYMSAESAAKIDAFGRYGSTGTTLQVKGTFHLVGAGHEGLSGLDAEVVSVVEPGDVHPDAFNPEVFVPGAAVIAAGLVLLGVFYWLRERQR